MLDPSGGAAWAVARSLYARSRLHLLATLLVAVVAAAGCTVGDDPFGTNDSQPAPGDAGVGDASLTVPQLDPGLPRTSCAKTVAIRGHAQPGATVFAVGGEATAGSTDEANRTTGKFCIPVALQKGVTNKIEVRAQHPALGVSPPAIIHITHRTNCDTTKDDVSGTKKTASATSSHNVAQGQGVKSKDTPESGTNSSVTDGDKSSYVTFKGGGGWKFWQSYDGWVSIRLDKVYGLKKVIVRWKDSSGSGSAYGKEYRVLVSGVSKPGDPSLDGGDWQEIKHVSDGDGGKDVLEFGGKTPVAQHVAIWLQYDGANSISETFRLSEVEVYNTVDKTTSFPQQTSVCSGQ